MSPFYHFSLEPYTHWAIPEEQHHHQCVFGAIITGFFCGYCYIKNRESKVKFIKFGNLFYACWSWRFLECGHLSRSIL